MGVVVQSTLKNQKELLESTADGVKTYNLRKRLRQWNIICPTIVVRRLVCEKTPEFYQNCSNFLQKVSGMKYGKSNQIIFFYFFEGLKHVYKTKKK